jgi:hypothetical protein
MHSQLSTTTPPLLLRLPFRPILLLLLPFLIQHAPESYVVHVMFITLALHIPLAPVGPRFPYQLLNSYY